METEASPEPNLKEWPISWMEWPRKGDTRSFCTREVPSQLAVFPRGKIKGVIKELIQRRVKLKAAERLAENLAEQVQSHLSEKENKIRQEYESRLERCVCMFACVSVHVQWCQHMQADGRERRGV